VFFFSFVVSSATLRTVLNRIDLFDQATIDDLLVYCCFFLSLSTFLSSFNSSRNFRSEHANEMIKLAAIESENSNGESTLDTSTLKPTSSKRPAVSPAAAKSAVPQSSKKGLVIHSFNSRSFLFFSLLFRTGKDTQPVEIIPDEPEPSSFAGQLLITGISLTCRLITSEIQQINLYRLIQLPSITNLCMPLPIIPILQSGPIYPGKQSLIKYFMLIPTPTMVHNEEVDYLNIYIFFLKTKIFDKYSGCIKFIISFNFYVIQ
jgi:hypothetical protein